MSHQPDSSLPKCCKSFEIVIIAVKFSVARRKMELYFFAMFALSLGLVSYGIFSGKSDFTLGGFVMFTATSGKWKDQKVKEELVRLRKVEAEYKEWKAKHLEEVERQKERVRRLSRETIVPMGNVRPRQRRETAV